MICSTSRFAHKLLDWYDQNRRDLPWRVPFNSAVHARPNPYHVLVSETMLQQTQVSTVIPYFRRFVQEFPTIQSLARAREQRVLRLWQGLGYYSRARNLRKTARLIVQRHECELPANLQQLMALPGVGRYTAGAIASLAFGIRAPIVDGNVARVLCRIERIESDPRHAATRRALWDQAGQILPGKRVGDFNSALMELGATVCIPRNPRCGMCPVGAFCKAHLNGVENQIPRPRASRENPLARRWTFCIRRSDGWLIEQRPSTGRWAGMWQFVTIPPRGAEPSARTVRSAFSLRTDRPRRIGTIAQALTHRRYEFAVYLCKTDDGTILKGDPRRAWIRLGNLQKFPLPRPHLRIAQMLANA